MNCANQTVPNDCSSKFIVHANMFVLHLMNTSLHVLVCPAAQLLLVGWLPCASGGD